MMEEQFVVEIHALGIKKTKAMIDEYNKALGDLKLTLQANFGTSNINSAISIAVASAALNVGMEIVEAIMTFGISELPEIISESNELPIWGPSQPEDPVVERTYIVSWYRKEEESISFEVRFPQTPEMIDAQQRLDYAKEFIMGTELETATKLYWIDQAEKIFKSANIPARPDEIFKMAWELRKAKDLSGDSP